jgi:hypothetical protein
MQKIFFTLLCLFALKAGGQTGCPDPQALNYNASAQINDGSCIYGLTSYALSIRDTLPPALSEISGMAYWNGKLYVHNDSGNPSNLFEIDTSTGLITKEIYLNGVTNTDWEDITQDNSNFYIADAGNNAGNRTNLRILKFPKNTISANYFDTIQNNEVEYITFTYPDQVDFNNNQNNTAFDCEAIACRNNLLHLFTKNWTGGPCVHYTLPTMAGNYVATRLDSLDTGGTLITAADFAQNNQLMLLGYKNSGTAECSLWYIYDFDNTDSIFIKGNKRKINMGDALLVGQIEGVCFVDSSHGFASNERFNPIAPIDISQKLYEFNTLAWYPYALNTGTQQIIAQQSSLHCSASSHQIDVYFDAKEAEQLFVSIYSGKGKKIRSKSFHCMAGSQHLQVDNLELSSGIYYVILQQEDGERKISKIFFENR